MPFCPAQPGRSLSCSLMQYQSIMPTEDILRDLPCTEDTHKRFLQWLNKANIDGHWQREGENGTSTSSCLENEQVDDTCRSTASRGVPNSIENGPTASPGGPNDPDRSQRQTGKSTAPLGGSHLLLRVHDRPMFALRSPSHTPITTFA